MSRPRILLTTRWPAEVEQHLAERYDVTLNEQDAALDPTALGAALVGVDAICPTVTDRIDAEILRQGPQLRLIANYGVGVNHIDLNACRRLGIAVTNTPDVLTDCTANLAITLMLMATRRAGEGERELRGGRWTGWRPTHLPGADIAGKTLGIVGFGRIGQTVARKAEAAFGMRVLYVARRSPDLGTGGPAESTQCATLEELLERSDIVSLHCPGTAENRHLIDAVRLGRMKRSAFLINTARGSIVDEAALAVALASGRIAGAGLDVYEDEPYVTVALIGLENVVLLPHLGSATSETRIAMGMRVARNLDRFFGGETLEDHVA